MKKIAEAKILSPTDYWEKKLNVKFDDELILYKSLCISKLSRKEQKILKKKTFNTYKEWSTYWTDNFSNLEFSEREELTHFFENRIRISSLFDKLLQNLLFPLVINLLASTLIPNSLNQIFSNNNQPVYLLLDIGLTTIITIAIFSYYFKQCVHQTKDEELEHYFYIDLKKIILTNELTFSNQHPT